MQIRIPAIVVSFCIWKVTWHCLRVAKGIVLPAATMLAPAPTTSFQNTPSPPHFQGIAFLLLFSYWRANIMSTIVQSAEQGTAGVVIWGDHHSQDTKTDCIEIKNYMNNFLGPCRSTKLQSGVLQFAWKVQISVKSWFMFQSFKSKVNLDFLSDRWKFWSCRC